MAYMLEMYAIPERTPCNMPIIEITIAIFFIVILVLSFKWPRYPYRHFARKKNRGTPYAIKTRHRKWVDHFHTVREVMRL